MVKIPKSFRVVSMALIIALFSQLIPMEVFAESDQNDLGSSQSGSIVEGEYVNIFENNESTVSNLTDDDILTEITDKREENIKYFLLSGGTIAAAVYNNPVHIRDDNGKWQDIDNTLSCEGEVLTESKNLILESVSDSSLSKTFSDIIKVTNQTVSESDIKVAGIGASSGANDNSVYEKSQDKLKISFEKQIKEGKLLSIKNDEYKIDWGLNNISLKSKQVNYSSVETEKGHTKTSTKSVSGVLKYVNVIDNVDLCYQLVGNDVKENVVLNKPSAAQVLEFSLKCGKLTPELNDNRILR